MIIQNLRADSVELTFPSSSASPQIPRLRIAALSCGADGSFAWYADAGDGYGYEKGEYAQAIFTWRDAERALYISARTGSFPGMQKRTRLLLRLAGEEKASVLYEGTEMRVAL